MRTSGYTTCAILQFLLQKRRTLIWILLAFPSNGALVQGRQFWEPCPAIRGRKVAVFSGEVDDGRTFTKSFGKSFLFVLQPKEKGWLIAVYRKNNLKDSLASLTPPMHGPNPLFIEGWHFRNETNTGENDGSVNVPQRERLFIFSPTVPSLIRSGKAREISSIKDLDPIADFGRGELGILDFRLADLEPGQRARMVWLKFQVCLSWRDP